MGQVGWIYLGDYYTHQEMMSLAATYPEGFSYTPDMLEEMLQGEERDYISPSTLGGCARQWKLKREEPYYEELDKAWPKFRGTLAHAVMEAGPNEPDAILEISRERVLETPLGPVIIYGKPDKVIPSLKLLIDYKTIKAIERKPKAAWIQQLSCYRWLLAGDGIEVERAIIQQISMALPYRLEIPLWDLEYTEIWLKARVPEFVLALEPGDTYPRALIEGIDDNTWVQCQWCPVAAKCRALQREGK